MALLLGGCLLKPILLIPCLGMYLHQLATLAIKFSASRTRVSDLRHKAKQHTHQCWPVFKALFQNCQGESLQNFRMKYVGPYLSLDDKVSTSPKLHAWYWHMYICVIYYIKVLLYSVFGSMWDLSFSQHCCWKFYKSSMMLCCVFSVKFPAFWWITVPSSSRLGSCTARQHLRWRQCDPSKLQEFVILWVHVRVQETFFLIYV